MLIFTKMKNVERLLGHSLNLYLKTWGENKVSAHEAFIVVAVVIEYFTETSLLLVA